MAKNDKGLDEYKETDTIKSIDRALTFPELQKISKRANKKAKDLLKDKEKDAGKEDLL